MSQITIHIHPQLAQSLLAAGPDGARALGTVSQQAARIVQAFGWHIAYAPVRLPNGSGCAMSVRGGQGGVVVDIDRPGTAIPGRGVVVQTEQAARKGRALRR
jgi:hypothetical protein